MTRYEKSRDNPYTPDMDITHLCILLYLSEHQYVPSVLENYHPLLKNLYHLERNKYLYKTTTYVHNRSEKLWNITTKGRVRCDVYRTFNSVVPPQCRNYSKPEIKLHEVRSLLKIPKNTRSISHYLYSYEACLVYQLNQNVQGI
jgi:hypothetical protein